MTAQTVSRERKCRITILSHDQQDGAARVDPPSARQTVYDVPVVVRIGKVSKVAVRNVILGDKAGTDSNSHRYLFRLS